MKRFAAARHALVVALSALGLSSCIDRPAIAMQARSGHRAAAAAVDSLLRATLANRRTPGVAVAVVVGSDTIALRGIGLADVDRGVAMTDSTVFRVGSISKQFVAAGIMRLVEQGRLRLEDPITRHVPEAETGGHHVTLARLLSHTSGVPQEMRDPWPPSMVQTVRNDDALARYRHAQVEFPPGERWSYNNYGYLLLGVTLERVSGKSYHAYLDDEFFRPLGMRSTRYCPELTPDMAKGHEVNDSGAIVVRDTGWMNMSMVGPGGAHCSTLRDLLRWQHALATGRVVTAASYALMTTPARLNDGTTTPYGFGLGLRDVDGERGISHGGMISGYMSYLSRYPDTKLSIVVLINSRAEPSRPLAESLARVVMRALKGDD